MKVLLDHGLNLRDLQATHSVGILEGEDPGGVASKMIDANGRIRCSRATLSW